MNSLFLKKKVIAALMAGMFAFGSFAAADAASHELRGIPGPLGGLCARAVCALCGGLHSWRRAAHGRLARARFLRKNQFPHGHPGVFRCHEVSGGVDVNAAFL